MTDHQPVIAPAIRDGLLDAIDQAVARWLDRQPLMALVPLLIEPDAGLPLAPALPALLSQMHLEGWRGGDLATDDDARRRLLQGGLARQKRYGTPGGVEEVLARVGLPSAHIHERLGAGAMPASRYNGAYRYDGEIGHDGNSIAAGRGWAIFGLSFDAADLAASRNKLDRIRAVVSATKRGVCHLAWIKPEQRLTDVLPSPVDSQSLIAHTAIADQLLPGPRYDGVHAYGGAAIPRHDAIIHYDGVVTCDGSPVVTSPAQIHYGRPLMADVVTITVRRAISSPLDAPARHDAALHYNGGAHHTGRRPALTDATTVTITATPPGVLDWDDATGWDDGLGWIDG